MIWCVSQVSVYSVVVVVVDVGVGVVFVVVVIFSNTCELCLVSLTPFLKTEKKNREEKFNMILKRK